MEKFIQMDTRQWVESRSEGELKCLLHQHINIDTQRGKVFSSPSGTRLIGGKAESRSLLSPCMVQIEQEAFCGKWTAFI